MPATELAQFAQYTIKDASDSSFTTPVTVARVSSFNLNDSYDVQSVDDFDQAAGEIVDQLLGGRTITLNFDTNLVLSDAGYQQINTKYKAGTYSYCELSLADTENTASTFTLQLGGYWSSRNISGQKPAATGGFSFVASEIVSDAIA